MIAYCGLDCGGCPIHRATLVRDPGVQRAMREEIARQCSEYYGMNMLPEEINDCDGCSSRTGRLFRGCVDCMIRRCAIGRKLDSCARCPDYACDPLLKHFKTDQASRTRLEAIRSALSGGSHS